MSARFPETGCRVAQWLCPFQNLREALWFRQLDELAKTRAAAHHALTIWDTVSPSRFFMRFYLSNRSRRLRGSQVSMATS
jgi:hypothetical protein